MHLARDPDARRLVVLVQQHDVLIHQVHVTIPRPRRLVADHRVNPQRLGRMINPPAHLEQRIHHKIAVRTALVAKRRQIQYPRRPVDLLFNLPHRRLARIQHHVDRRAEHTAEARQVQLRHVRRHLVQPVAVGVRRQPVRVTNAHFHPRRPRHQQPLKRTVGINQVDLPLAVAEVIHFLVHHRRVHLAREEDPRPLAALHVHQLDRRLVRQIHVAVPRPRRLVTDHRLNVQGHPRPQHPPAHLDQRIDIEIAVGATARPKRRQVQYPRRRVHLLLNLAPGRIGRIQADHHRPKRRARAHQIKQRHLRRHLIQSVPIGVRRKTVRIIEAHQHFRRPGHHHPLRHQLPRRRPILQVDLALAVAEVVPLLHRIGHVHLAHDPVAGRKTVGVDHIDRHLGRQIHVTFPRAGRLVADHCLDVQRSRQVEYLRTNFEQRVNIEIAVGTTSLPERIEIQHSRNSLHFFFNLARSWLIRIEHHADRPQQRMEAEQI